MATVTSRAVVEEIIRGNGRYLDDPPVVKIVEYENEFDGGIAWGLIYGWEDPMRYETAPACRNPRVIFVRGSER
jgi:hypothetical protein